VVKAVFSVILLILVGGISFAESLYLVPGGIEMDEDKTILTKEDKEYRDDGLRYRRHMQYYMAMKSQFLKHRAELSGMDPEEYRKKISSRYVAGTNNNKVTGMAVKDKYGYCNVG